MEFVAKLREVGGSLCITVPSEIVAKLKLKEGDIKEFSIKSEKYNPDFMFPDELKRD